MKFQLFLKAHMLKNRLFLASNSQMVYIMLINVKIYNIFSMINFMVMSAQLSLKKVYNLGDWVLPKRSLANNARKIIKILYQNHMQIYRAWI